MHGYRRDRPLLLLDLLKVDQARAPRIKTPYYRSDRRTKMGKSRVGRSRKKMKTEKPPDNQMSEQLLVFIKAVKEFLEKAVSMTSKDLEIAGDHWQNFTATFTDILQERNLCLPLVSGDIINADLGESRQTSEEQETQVHFPESQAEAEPEEPGVFSSIGLEDLSDNKGDYEQADEMLEENDGGTPSGTEDNSDQIQIIATGESLVSNPAHVCPTCGRGFSNLSNVTRHVMKVHKNIQSYICQLCQQGFTLPRHLEKHLRTTHSILSSSKQPDIKCEQCGKIFTNRSNLKVHINHCHDGRREYSCPECGKTFQTRSNLNRHVQSTHRGMKPWECSTCHASFTEKKSLERHASVHTGLKMYRCDECGKCLATKWSLSQHQMKHSNIRPYLCDTCGQTFLTKSNLDGHKQIHLGLRTHPCTFCKRSFFSKGDLDRHVRSHTGVKPYSCQVCSKPFSRLEYLHEHLNAHAGITPYTCSTCDKGFSDRSGYHKHSKRCALRLLTARQATIKQTQQEQLLPEDLGPNDDSANTTVLLPEPHTIIGEVNGQTVTFIDLGVKHQTGDFTDALQMFYPNDDEDQSGVITEHVIHVTSEDHVVGEGERLPGEHLLEEMEKNEEMRVKVEDEDAPQDQYCVLNDDDDDVDNEDKTEYVIPAEVLVSEDAGIDAGMNAEDDLSATSEIQWYVQQVVPGDTWHDPPME